MDYQTIIVKRKKRVGIITLNRPDKHNALNTQLEKETLEALRELENAPGIGSIIIRGGGSSFCSGHDFSELKGETVVELRKIFRQSLYLIETINTIGKPVIASVHGYATAMGCALAVGCDLVIAAEDALFQLPGVRFGIACISPVAVLSRSVGRKKCLELLLTADPIDARQAERAGLVNRVVPLEVLDSVTEGLAERITHNAPLALQLGKQAFYTMSGMAQNQAYNYAAEMMSINTDTGDGQEGVTSFLEKRKPQPWKNR
ncbi:enoyl-CoA hydratase-related protein [Chloroflexota bacterium]